MHDTLIHGATIVDGSGGEPFTGDVVLDGDQITRISSNRSGVNAKRKINADGLILTPGIIDPHTHYDAQVCWDGLLTSSPEHGVTTVITGNCGVGVAPARPDLHELLIGDLVNVEGIPYEVLKQGIDWRWESFGEYLDSMDETGLGINVAALVAITPIRHLIMGAAARQRAATDEEAAEIGAEFGRAMASGAFGFSTTVLGIHVGYEGEPLACRNAGNNEYQALCGVLKELDRGSIQLTVTPTDTLDQQQREFLEMLVNESGRPVTWVGSFNTPGNYESYLGKLAVVEDLLARDKLVPMTTCHPIKFQFHLRNPFILGLFEAFRPVMAMELEQKIEQYRSQEFRRQFVADVERNEALGSDFWHRVRLIDGEREQTLRLAESKKTIAQMAADSGKQPVDVLFEIAFDDDLGAIFELVTLNHDPGEVIPLINDERLLIGLSDAGAHVDMMCDAGFGTHLLSRWVREEKVLTVQDAIRRITSEQAEFFGIARRGTIAEGNFADLALFDLTRVRPLESEKAFDLPGGGKRWVQHAEGVHGTFVNGELLYQDGVYQGGMPGRALRSYDS